MTKKTSGLSPEKELRRKQAEADLVSFIELVHPRRLLGDVHREVISWWNREDAKKNQLLLLPRDHMKSALAGYRVAHALTKDPTLRILYISSTSNLAVKQLKFIKDILTCSAYREHWPEMVEKEETKREKWTEREISVDHPLRKLENIRDPSVFTAGLTSNIVGMHCDIAVLDDVVVQSNAYTEDGREKVKGQYSYLSSILGTDGQIWAVGTRYHSKDLYNDMLEMTSEVYNDVGEVIAKDPMFEIFERQVESIGDGTGEFLWPRQQRSDGKWFGFNREILSEKRNHYQNKMYFRAQYYNDPQDVDSSPFQRALFQYYDPKFLAHNNGRWFFKGERINVFASVDFAYSLTKGSDYTAIVVIGVDRHHNYYVLEIDRFKTDRPSEYFTHILKLHEKWGFRKLRAEVTAAQNVIVKDIKENYIRKHGLGLVVEEYRPSRWTGSKEERILSTLEPKYANGQVWHYRGGNCQVLEEELMFKNPAHDDVKDCLASVIDFAVPPTNTFQMQSESKNEFVYHSRWGGVA